MNGSFRYILIFFGALIITWILTPRFREIATKIGMVDKPDERRINKVPIPRGGGISIIIGVLIMLWVGQLFLGTESKCFSSHWLIVYTIATVLLSIVGFTDDYRGIPPPVKLAGQIVVALIFFFSGFSFNYAFPFLPYWVNLALTLFWIVGAINAFNLIDGLDGLATGLALIACFGLAGSLLFQNRAIDICPYLILAGSCLAFLRYNFNPASVFLGDTGSMFLGMSLATLPLASGNNNEMVVSLGMPILVMGIPIFDTFLAIWRRTVRALLKPNESVSIVGQNGGALMQPDKDHLHHRLLRMFMNNQKKVAITLYLSSLILVLLGLSYSFLKARATGFFLIAFVSIVFVLVRHFDCVELWNTGRLLSKLTLVRRKSILLPLSIVGDLIVVTVSFFFTWFFIFADLPQRFEFINIFPFFVMPYMVMFVLCRINQRIWSRACARDFMSLFAAVTVGTLFSLGGLILFDIMNKSLVRFCFLMGLVSYFGFALIRVSRSWLVAIFNQLEFHFLVENSNKIRVLAYGGGRILRHYMDYYRDDLNEKKRLVVGVVDDDPYLKGRVVAGLPVWGNGETIEEVIKEHNIDAVVITCVLPEENKLEIIKRLKALSLPVSIYISKEKRC